MQIKVLTTFANIRFDKKINTNETCAALQIVALVRTLLTAPMLAPKLVDPKSLIHRST